MLNKYLFEALRQPKTTKNDKIIPFSATFNPNNLNIFLILKQIFANFQYSKTISNIFQKKETCYQAPNLGRFL